MTLTLSLPLVTPDTSRHPELAEGRGLACNISVQISLDINNSVTQMFDIFPLWWLDYRASIRRSSRSGLSGDLYRRMVIKSTYCGVVVLHRMALNGGGATDASLSLQIAHLAGGDAAIS